MKTALPVALALASAAGSVHADQVPMVANATLDVPTATNGSKIQLQGIHCTPRTNDGMYQWYYNSKSDGPYNCKTEASGGGEWSMLNAYRSGGTEGIHWKYTDNVNDSECLKGWKYYSADGETLIATVSGRTTTANDPRRWCALPVYRSGGVYDKQWADCWCQWE